MRPARRVLARTLGMAMRVCCHAVVKHRETQLGGNGTWRATRERQLLGSLRSKAVAMVGVVLGARHVPGALGHVKGRDERRWLVGAIRITVEAVEWPVGEGRNCDCWKRWVSLRSAGWEP